MIIRNPVKKTGGLKAKASFPIEKVLDHIAYIAMTKAMDMQKQSCKIYKVAPMIPSLYGFGQSNKFFIYLDK